jgi:hypothetical protein
MNIELTTHGDDFQLKEDVEIKGYTIPKGFVTDFATIPRFALSLMGRPTRQQFRRASLLHDYLLKETDVSNEESSRLFYEVLLEDGTKPFKAYIMYLSVKYLRKVYRKIK